MIGANIFDEMIRLAGIFVHERRGVWDYYNWIEFLSDLQKRGINVNGQMENYIAQVLENMKKLYIASVSTRPIEYNLIETTLCMMNFTKKTMGAWNVSDVQQFIRELQKQQIALTEEMRIYHINLLEAMNKLYFFVVGI